VNGGGGGVSNMHVVNGGEGGVSRGNSRGEQRWS